MLRATAVLLLSLAACNDTAIVGDPKPDGPGGGSGPGPVTASVMTVTCPADLTGIPSVITTSATEQAQYMPNAVTISVGGIVQFVMPATHNVVPNTLTTTDPGLAVDYGQTKCLKFTHTGTFAYYCTMHGFRGTVTVQ